MEDKVWAESGLLQHGLTLSVVNDGDLNFFENLLVRSLRESILAPSSGLATLSGEVDQPVGQADWADVRVSGIVDVPVDPDESNVVEEVARVVLIVDEDVYDVKLDVGVELGVVVHIPFTNTDSKKLNSFKMLVSLNRSTVS